MKVALYTRVSTISQTTENQKIRLIDFANNKGWHYEMFEETESTRKTRPVKQSLLAKLRAKEFDAVIIVTLDAYYTKDALDLKLLYVAMTRALHHLSVFYLNDSMPVLNNIKGYEYTSQSDLS